MGNKLELKIQNLQRENKVLKQIIKLVDGLRRYSPDAEGYVLLRKDDPLVNELIIQKNCPKKKRTKMELSDILTLFDKYGISNLKDLERTLYFTCYYKTENLELKDEIRKLKNPTAKYVVVENPKTRRKTIMEKIRNISETYRACKYTSYTGYFQVIDILGEFETPEDARIACKIFEGGNNE